mgnify:FL=1
MTKQQKESKQLCGRLPGLLDRLIQLAEQEDAKPATVVAAMKEIRAAAEELQENQKIEIVVKLVEHT